MDTHSETSCRLLAGRDRERKKLRILQLVAQEQRSRKAIARMTPRLGSELRAELLDELLAEGHLKEVPRLGERRSLCVEYHLTQAGADRLAEALRVPEVDTSALDRVLHTRTI